MSTTNTPVSSANSAANLFTNMNVANKKASDAQSTEDRFLKLLITQLKNQDPMNPTDSAQTTSQMAQISTVSGIENLNASISSMMTTFNAGQSYQAAGLIGHEVLAKGDVMTFDGKSAVTGQVKVPDGGGTVTLSIYNSNNQLVRTIDGGSQAPGMQGFTWDGKDDKGNVLPAGSYAVSSVSKGSDGKSVSDETYTNVRVSSVSITASGVKLQLADGTEIAMSDVTQIQ
jgi:flagellar basal-body rod modification protein FlgD